MLGLFLLIVFVMHLKRSIVLAIAIANDHGLLFCDPLNKEHDTYYQRNQARYPKYRVHATEEAQP